MLRLNVSFILHLADHDHDHDLGVARKRKNFSARHIFQELYLSEARGRGNGDEENHVLVVLKVEYRRSQLRPYFSHGCVSRVNGEGACQNVGARRTEQDLALAAVQRGLESACVVGCPVSRASKALTWIMSPTPASSYCGFARSIGAPLESSMAVCLWNPASARRRRPPLMFLVVMDFHT